MTYLFDGSLSGLLSAVYEWFERKPGQIYLFTEHTYQPQAFSTSFVVKSDKSKSDRVWKGLVKALDKGWQRKFYCAYLSEDSGAFQHLFEFACYVFQHPAGAAENYGNDHVLALSKFARSVEREKHRMEAFIRFEHTVDGIFYATIDPDFNVIPLIAKHFKDRYADQQWIIYDKKRKYGIYYDLTQVTEISFSEGIKRPTDQVLFNEKEHLYALLWKDYFKSTNIVARKNTKLHIRHVPKRYWKYLTEKQIEI